MITIRHERPADVPAREALLDLAYRPGRATPSRRSGCATAACRPRACRSSRSTAARRRHRAALARHRGRTAARRCCSGRSRCDPKRAGRGVGAALVRRALAEARRLGHGAVILVGDAPYYSRFGFTADKTGALKLPGPFERHRLLALELVPARSTAPAD